MKRILLLFCFCLSSLFLLAKSYHVELFQANYELNPQNQIIIDEHLLFNFQKGHFTWADRELSSKHIDRLKIISATIDNQPIPFGIGINRAQLTSNSIKWNFTKTSKEKHDLGVKYLVEGAIFQTDDGDILEMSLLPDKHQYQIDSVCITLNYNTFKNNLIGHRLLKGNANIRTTDSSLVIFNSGKILKNQSIHFQLIFKKGCLISSNPKWFALKLKAKKLMVTYLILSFILIVFSTFFSIKIFHKYSLAFKLHKKDSNRLDIPTEGLHPGEAAFLLSQSMPEYHHIHYVIATLLEMFKNNLIIIKNTDHRKCSLVATDQAPSFNEYEKLVFEAIFHKQKTDLNIDLKKGLSNANLKTEVLTKKIKTNLIKEEFISEYLLSRKRKYTFMGILINALGFLCLIPFIIFFDFFTISALYLIFSLIVSGILIIAGAQSISPLTPRGLHSSQNIYYFKKHLMDILNKDYNENTHQYALQYLSWIFAFGLQAQWYTILKNKTFKVPDWFNTLNNKSEDIDFNQFFFVITTLIAYSDSATTATISKGNSSITTGDDSSSVG